MDIFLGADKRTNQDTGNVVVLARLLLLAEVADDVKAVVVALAHHVEQERVGVVIQGLVVEEQLGQEAQILSVGLVLAAVDLKERNVALPVDFVARRMSEIAFRDVPLQANNVSSSASYVTKNLTR